MCEVCAIFGAGEHWSDFSRLRNERFPFADIMHYRRERARRLEILNSVLVSREIRCADWDGEALSLHDHAGRFAVAPTLSDVWPMVQKMSGTAFDPLAEDRGEVSDG